MRLRFGDLHPGHVIGCSIALPGPIGSGCFLAGFGEGKSLVAEVGDELQGRGDPEAQVRQVLNPEFLVEIEALAAT